MKTYIHIGYPKNASTTLQTDVFPNIKGASYLGRIYDSEQPFVSREISEAIYSISMQDSIEFSYVEVQNKIRYALQHLDGQYDKTIISWEAFSHNIADRGLMAERLNKIFPDARVLVIIRNQMDALQSMYAFLVCQLGKNINLSYGRPSVESFEKWILEQEEFINRSFLSTLKYYEFISEYRKVFGKDNVTVLLFEELASSPALFFEKIAHFFDVDNITRVQGSPLIKRNKRPSKRILLYYKLRGRFPGLSPSKIFHETVINWARKFFDSKKDVREDEVLPPEMQERLMNMYRESNRKLQQELGVDLAQYGYLI